MVTIAAPLNHYKQQGLLSLTQCAILFTNHYAQYGIYKTFKEYSKKLSWPSMAQRPNKRDVGKAISNQWAKLNCDTTFKAYKVFLAIFAIDHMGTGIREL